MPILGLQPRPVESEALGLGAGAWGLGCGVLIGLPGDSDENPGLEEPQGKGPSSSKT